MNNLTRIFFYFYVKLYPLSTPQPFLFSFFNFLYFCYCCCFDWSFMIVLIYDFFYKILWTLEPLKIGYAEVSHIMITKILFWNWTVWSKVSYDSIQEHIILKLDCLKFRSAKADLFKTTSCWQICFPDGNIRGKWKHRNVFFVKKHLQKKVWKHVWQKITHGSHIQRAPRKHFIHCTIG